jgi:predicted ABC-type sugar transport system permease subunit
MAILIVLSNNFSFFFPFFSIPVEFLNLANEAIIDVGLAVGWGLV